MDFPPCSLLLHLVGGQESLRLEIRAVLGKSFIKRNWVEQGIAKELIKLINLVNFWLYIYVLKKFPRNSEVSVFTYAERITGTLKLIILSVLLNN